MTQPTKHSALIGNPNSGKTVLFNRLTGHHQRIGNWAGVTVTRKEGTCTYQGHTLEIIDLPGTYSCSSTQPTDAVDCRIVCDYIRSNTLDIIINVIDATHLERSLYLTTQLCDMQLPLVVVLNMMDVAEKTGLQIDIAALSQQLGCPVIPMVASRGKGITALQKAIVHYQPPTEYPVVHALAQQNPAVQHAIDTLIPALEGIAHPHTTWGALQLLEGADTSNIPPTVHAIVSEQRTLLKNKTGQSVDTQMADRRYSWIHTLIAQVQTSKTDSERPTCTQRLDRMVLHRWFGIPVFLGVMYVLFACTLNIGGILQAWCDQLSDAFFVQDIARWMHMLHAPVWSIALVAHGIGRGINTTLTFIPVIGVLFLCLCVLEDSGYMARAAFVVDRGMQAMGLPGGSFIPMMIGFGCNVPAIMATRTLSSFRDRVLTTLMMPFMSCSARLAIYAIFVAAFFPTGGIYVVFALYLLGILAALCTGYLLRSTHFSGPSTPLVMELPAYHRPRITSVLRHTWHRLRHFLWRAGTLIIPVCTLISALNAVTIDGTLVTRNTPTPSVLAWAGQKITPALAPMGIHAENWPATVGLLTGILAKEVVVGSLNTLYSQQSPLHTGGIHGIMRHHFDGGVGAFAYLLFVLLYFPCVSTAAVMARELNRYWASFSILWSLGLAYGVAVFFYQAATFTQHPTASLGWMLGISTTLVVFLGWLRSGGSRGQAAGRRGVGVQQEKSPCGTQVIAACGGICKRCPVAASV